MKKTIILMTLFLISLLAGSASAVPGIPNQFYGSVTYNSAPAPDGTRVTANIDGKEVSSTTTSNGVYSLIVDDPDNTRAGEEVRFYVNGIDTKKTGIFCTACITEINLAVTYTPPDDHSSSSGSSSGSSGGSPSPPPVITGDDETPEETALEEQAGCTEKWSCSRWSACIDNVQTRRCADTSNCGTEDHKPFESQPCTELEQRTTQSTGLDSASPTAFAFLENLGNPVNLAALGIIIIAVLVGLYARRSMKKGQKKE